jgi:uncharacterized 2Fe-2S/4Fe-4S cluster protein (DUF4445 family)
MMTPDKSSSKKTFQVDLEPVGKRIDIERGTNLLEAAQLAGVQLTSLCGGTGLCDSCRVRVDRGEVSEPTFEEREIFGDDLASGFRLACQTIPESDVKIDIPPESLTTPQRLQIEGQEVSVTPEPVVRSVDISIPPPTLEDLRSDVGRLTDVLGEMEIRSPSFRLPLLRDLSSQVRAQDYSASIVLRGDEVVALLPQGEELLGLAVDVGTTKLAAYLVDLADGKTLAKQGAMNPQVGYGEDVISRIAFANQQEHAGDILQSKLIEAINTIIGELTTEAQASPEQIVDAVVVGNTSMHHLFAGLPVRQLGIAPYVPAVADAFDVPVSDLGLQIAPGAYIHLPPNIAGYVGADHVAMLLATGMSEASGVALALDIGTNTEISLSCEGRLLTCSCASGPAFEGAHIHDGMRASQGAIERVQIIGDNVFVQTIDSQPAVGICGSGILDAVAEMLKAGIIDPRGALQEESPHVRGKDADAHLLLVPAAESGHKSDIIVTRKDVNEIQLAKGAIRAGIEVLLKEAGIEYQAIDTFIVAGAFGTYLDVNSAVRIGMFPSLPLERFHQVGNAAGIGAKQILISSVSRDTAKEIVRKVEYLELTTHPEFTDEFMNALFLAEYRQE